MSRHNPLAPNSLLLVAVGFAGLVGCRSASGAALASRSEAPPASPHRMVSTTRSRMADELAAAGLDPRALPVFAELSQRQRLLLMNTFTRSMGLACTDCHDRTDYSAPTRRKAITVEMWDDLTRPNRLEDGSIVYCDSCHSSSGAFLDRSDKKRVARFMAAEYVGKLVRRDERPVECATCHGDPFRPLFLPR